MTTTSNFVLDPLSYARVHALQADSRTQASTGADMALLESDGVTLEPVGTTTYLKVKAMHRIQWFQLAPSNQPRGPTRVTWSLTPQADHAAAYYLPWVQNDVVGITLQRSKKVLDDEKWRDFKSQNFTQLNSAERARLRAQRETLLAADPDIFFTAPVNGCAVFITGPEEAPTVFHANASAHNPNGSFADATTVSEFWRVAEDKSQHMTQQFRNIQTHKPKQVRTGGPGTWGHAPPAGHTRVAKARHYLDPVGLHPAFDNQLPQKLVSLGLETRVQQWRQWLSERYYGPAESNEDIQYGNQGCVFGKRVHGRWQFWYQKIFLQQRMDMTTGASQQSWTVEECRLFWPGASGFLSLASDWASGRMA